MNITSDKIIISTGSKPFFPKDLKPNGKRIIDSDFVLNSKSLPESICIIGGGYIGIEFAYLYSSFGVEVTIIESSESILGFVDKEIVDELRKNFTKRGITIYESTKVKIIKETSREIRVSLLNSDNELEIDYDLVLISTGRMPNTENLSLENSGVKIDNFGFIKVNFSINYIQINF